MYDRLFQAWKNEGDGREIQQLPKGFYTELSYFMKTLLEEVRATDERSLRGRILTAELGNTRRLTKELLDLRLTKLVTGLLKGEEIPVDRLTLEEESLHSNLSHLSKSYVKMVEDITEGRGPRIGTDIASSTPTMALIRFLKETPTIIGADMRAYGPFKPEDVALLPIENAEALIKQGAALKLETGEE